MIRTSILKEMNVDIEDENSMYDPLSEEETELPNLDGIKTGDAKQAANFIRNNAQFKKLIGNINNANEVPEFFSVLLGYMQDIKGVNKQNLKGLIDAKFK